jgi:hypothetical protein
MPGAAGLPKALNEMPPQRFTTRRLKLLKK